MAGAMLAGALAAQAEKPPNVLFLVADDWNAMVGAMGCPQAVTPNLDRLAAGGTVFLNAHAPATWCAPSRTAIMTGLLPHRTGCYGEQPHMFQMPERQTIPDRFRAAGYSVAGAGKIYHHMPGQVDPGRFDEYFIWNEAHKKKGWGLFAWHEGSPAPPDPPVSDIAKYLGMPLWDIWAMPNGDEEAMADTLGANWAAAYLERKHEKPFFLAYGVYAPHKQNYAPQKYFDLYPLEQIRLPEVDADELADLPEGIRRIAENRAKRIHDRIVENGDWKVAVQGYLACVSYADAMLGRVLDALDRSPYRDNTVVVFWSDNGYHLGENTWWAKHSLWRPTTRVPFIWAGPGIPQGVRVENPVGLIDTCRTLVDLCGLPAVEEADGQSLVPVFRNPSHAEDREVLINFDDSYAVVNRHWRYIRRPDGEELYHTENDPAERRNLASNPEYAGVMRTLAKKIPDHPAPAGPVPYKTLRLVVEGESFHWEPVRKNRPQ